MLFRFKKVEFPLCSDCIEEEKTLLHLFHSCSNLKQLPIKLTHYLSQFINIPVSSRQSYIVGLFDYNQHSFLMDHLLLI